MRHKTPEGLRFHRTDDRGIVEVPGKEWKDHAHNPREKTLARRRRLGTIARTAGAVTLGLGALLAVAKIDIDYALKKHDITPTGIGVGGFILQDDAELLTLNGNAKTGQTTQISWDQVTTPDGIPFKGYQTMKLENPPIREVPELGNPYRTYAILDNVKVDGKTMDLAVDYSDPNFAHKLGNGFSDIGSFQITPDGKYRASYKGDPIDPNQIGVIIPGEPKK